MKWIDPKLAAIANLVTLVVSVGTLVWGAASISSSVGELEQFREEAVEIHRQLRQDNHEQDLEIQHLQTIHDIRGDTLSSSEETRYYDSRSNTESAGRARRSVGPRVVEQPPEKQEEPKNRGASEQTRAALPGKGEDGSRRERR